MASTGLAKWRDDQLEIHTLVSLHFDKLKYLPTPDMHSNTRHPTCRLIAPTLSPNLRVAWPIIQLSGASTRGLKNDLILVHAGLQHYE